MVDLEKEIFYRGIKNIPEHPIRLVDSGLYHHDLLSGNRLADRTTIYIPSTSHTRISMLKDVIKQIGIPSIVKPVRGPEPEYGDTAVLRAMNKGLFALGDFIEQGYFERHPAEQLLIVAADSRNRIQNNIGDWVYRDKPTSFDEWRAMGEEWERAVMGDHIFEETGYAVIRILGNVLTIHTMTEVVQLIPHSRQAIQGFFDSIYAYETGKVNAHGCDTSELIQDNKLSVVSLEGIALIKPLAINAVKGASAEHLRKLVITALNSIISV